MAQDSYFDLEQGRWTSWEDLMEPFAPPPGLDFNKIFVPTIDTTRYSYLAGDLSHFFCLAALLRHLEGLVMHLYNLCIQSMCAMCRPVHICYEHCVLCIVQTTL